MSLSQDAIFRLWMQCQRPFDLAPFDLDFESSSSSVYDNGPAQRTQLAPRSLSKEPQPSRTSDEVSPSNLSPDKDATDDGRGPEPDQKAKTSSRSSEFRPSLARSTSGEASRKRTSATATTVRGKSRPTMSRKRSSQSTQPSENAKPRKSIIKSPRTSSEVQTEEPRRESATTILARVTASPSTTDELPGRKISAFELPSASSWQSVESHDHHTSFLSTAAGGEVDPNPLAIEKNFRERFKQQLHSSTNLASMNRAIRKTGSVVRFADEVDFPEQLRQASTANRQKDKYNEAVSQQAGESAASAASASRVSAGHPPRQSQTQAWRPGGLQRHDSTGSVAAVSEEGDEEQNDDEGIVMPLPRTKSQLSLAIKDLKRSQSSTAPTAEANENVVTSPQIEHDQQKVGKKRSEEEETLLAMGRKDGVTRAGGVNLPKELTVKGARRPDDRFEEPDAPLF